MDMQRCPPKTKIWGTSGGRNKWGSARSASPFGQRGGMSENKEKTTSGQPEKKKRKILVRGTKKEKRR